VHATLALAAATAYSRSLPPEDLREWQEVAGEPPRPSKAAVEEKQAAKPAMTQDQRIGNVHRILSTPLEN